MERTQVSLSEEQLGALRARAHERGVSIATLLREAVDGLLRSSSAEDAVDRSLAAVGSYRCEPENVSAEHDRFLGEIYRS